MRTRRAWPVSVVLPSLVAIAAAAAGWSSTSTRAQTASSTVLAPINGTVRGETEDVLFTGQARIDSKLAPGASVNRPSLLVLSIDLGELSGVGSATKAKYVITGPELVQRGVAASHLVEFAFPFLKSGISSMSSAQSGVASFALYFDVTTGAVTGASGHLTSAGPSR